ncbi:hypothetical protein Tco_1332780, partial [Tanacetum coccineum]
MNFLLQGIPNDIYNSVNACKTAKQMWERIRRLMHGSEKTKQQRHSRLVDEFDKFVAVAGESLSSMYERLTTLVYVMEWNNIRPLQISINTKFLNSLQPEWSKYVTTTREIQGDAQEDKLINVKMLLARAITQCYSTPTNIRLHTLSNTRNQAVIHDGRVDIQSKNVSYAENGNKNAGISNKNQIATIGNGMVQQIKANDEIIQQLIHDAKYFREQMLLAMKDEAGGNLNEEENDFMLDNHYGDDSLEELNETVIMIVRIHLKSLMHSESVHEHTNHAKLKTVITTFDDDQIDSSIIFDDPYMDNNGGTDAHDSNAHDQSVTLESLIQNVHKEAKNQRSLNNELKKQKALLQKELETYKEWVKTLEKQSVKSLNYKEAYEELEREIRIDKDKIDNFIKEKDKIQDEFFQLENATVIIRHETELSKKAFKARENKYLEEILDLEDKL